LTILIKPFDGNSKKLKLTENKKRKGACKKIHAKSKRRYNKNEKRQKTREVGVVLNSIMLPSTGLANILQLVA